MWADRSAQASERALLAGILPVLVPSRIDAPAENIRFKDDHWVHVAGGHALVEAADDALYPAMTLHNVGQELGGPGPVGSSDR